MSIQLNDTEIEIIKEALTRLDNYFDLKARQRKEYREKNLTTKTKYKHDLLIRQKQKDLKALRKKIKDIKDAF